MFDISQHNLMRFDIGRMDNWNPHEIQHAADAFEQDNSRETYGNDKKWREATAKIILVVRPTHTRLQHGSTFEEVRIIVRPGATHRDTDNMKLSTWAWLVFVLWAFSKVVVLPAGYIVCCALSIHRTRQGPPKKMGACYCGRNTSSKVRDGTRRVV